MYLGATSLNNLITLGTHTTGGYVATLTAGALIDLQNNSGETASPTIDVDLTEAAEAAIADGDYILFLDGGVTGTHAKESLADLVTLLAGDGLTATSSVLNVIGGNGITANANDMAITPAQTTITSIYATDLIIGEDSETAIDFGTPNEIDFKINNTTELTLNATALYPTGNAGLDLGTSGL